MERCFCRIWDKSCTNQRAQGLGAGRHSRSATPVRQRPECAGNIVQKYALENRSQKATKTCADKRLVERTNAECCKPHRSIASQASARSIHPCLHGGEWGTSPITRLRVLPPIGPMRTVNGEGAGNRRGMWTRDRPRIHVEGSTRFLMGGRNK